MLNEMSLVNTSAQLLPQHVVHGRFSDIAAWLDSDKRERAFCMSFAIMMHGTASLQLSGQGRGNTFLVQSMRLPNKAEPPLCTARLSFASRLGRPDFFSKKLQIDNDTSSGSHQLVFLLIS